MSLSYKINVTFEKSQQLQLRSMPASKIGTSAPQLHWDIVRLILLQLYLDTRLPASLLSSPSPTLTDAAPVRSSSLRCLLTCSLVSSDFRNEVQSLLFRDVDLSYFYKYAYPTYWAFDTPLPHRQRLCATVQTLHLPCVVLEPKVSALIRACPNLHSVVLQVANVEKNDCLIECIQGALAKATTVRQVTLLHPSSIRTIGVVYNLPYRLDKLHIFGLYGYRMNLWDNPEEYIDVGEVILEKSRILEWDVHYLFERMEHPKAAGPPNRLRLTSSQVDLERIPEATKAEMQEIELSDAQQLLQLDVINDLEKTDTLGLSSRHDFISLRRPLVRIKHLRVVEASDKLFKLLVAWLEQGLFPNLETASFSPGMTARRIGLPVARLGDLAVKLEKLLDTLNVICSPRKPSQMYHA